MRTIGAYILEKLHLDKDIQIVNDDTKKIIFHEMKSLVWDIMTNKVGQSNFKLTHEDNTNRLEINILKKGFVSANVYAISRSITSTLLNTVEKQIGKDIYTREPKIRGKKHYLIF